MALLALNESLHHTNRGAGFRKISRLLREVCVISSFLHQIAGWNSVHDAFKALFSSLACHFQPRARRYRSPTSSVLLVLPRSHVFPKSLASLSHPIIKLEVGNQYRKPCKAFLRLPCHSHPHMKCHSSRKLTQVLHFDRSHVF